MEMMKQTGSGSFRVPQMNLIASPLMHAAGQPLDRPCSGRQDESMRRARLGEVRTAIPMRPMREKLSASAVHRLCQPLTALQCILELGKDAEAVDELKMTLADSLRECARAIAMMGAFRELLEMGTRYSKDADLMDARQAAIDHGFRWQAGSGATAAGSAATGLCVLARPEAEEPVLFLANVEGLDFVFRELGRVLQSVGLRSAEDREAGAGSFSGVAFQRGGEVCFAWDLDAPRATAWERECRLADPFEVSDFDFTRNAVPSLAAARMVAEAMGATFCWGEFSVSLQFPQVPTARPGGALKGYRLSSGRRAGGRQTSAR